MRLWCVLALCFLSCNSPLPLKPSVWFPRYGQTLCELMVRCGVIGASEKQGCEDKRAELNQQQEGVFSLDQAVADGRLQFDEQASADCLTLLGASHCGILTAWASESCRKTFQGLVPVGSVCRSSTECVLGSYCGAGSNRLPDGCAGMCTAFVPTDGDCSIAPCNSTTDACDAATKRCVALAPEGGSCVVSAGCQSGLGCIYQQAGAKTGVCSKSGAVDQPCVIFRLTSSVSTLACETGLYCQIGSTTQVCRHPPGDGADCVFDCQDGLACAGALGGSQCTPWADAGDSCLAGVLAGRSGCPADMECNGTCTLPMVVGRNCMSDSDCKSVDSGIYLAGFYCDTTTGTCAAKRLVGQSCTPNGTGSDPCFQSRCDPGTRTCTVVCS